MKSIIQENKNVCYLCGRSGSEPLDCHHVFGGASRKKSEQYGLKVYLHHYSCHIFGAGAVHANGEVNRKLKADIQRKAMRYYGWSIEEFIRMFGKNYLGG